MQQLCDSTLGIMCMAGLWITTQLSQISRASRSFTDSAEGSMRGAKETLGRMTSVVHSVWSTRLIASRCVCGCDVCGWGEGGSIIVCTLCDEVNSIGNPSRLVKGHTVLHPDELCAVSIATFTTYFISTCDINKECTINCGVFIGYFTMPAI